MPNKELFSRQVSAGRRTYFIDLKQSKTGERYLKISESKHIVGDKFERHQIMLHQEHSDAFFEALAEVAAEFTTPPKPPTSSKPPTSPPKKPRWGTKKRTGVGAPWTPELDQKLLELHAEGKSTKELCEIFDRNRGGIQSRLKKLSK